MASGLAFLRPRGEKETLTTALTMATQRGGYPWMLTTRAFPPGRLSSHPRRGGVGSLSVAMPGNPEWSRIKVIYRPITLGESQKLALARPPFR